MSVLGIKKLKKQLKTISIDNLQIIVRAAAAEFECDLPKKKEMGSAPILIEWLLDSDTESLITIVNMIEARGIAKFERDQNRVTDITRQFCIQLQAEVLEAVQAVAAKHGLRVRNAGGSYSPESATVKVEFAAIAESGVASKQETNWKLYADGYGLKVEWLGKRIQMGRGLKVEWLGKRIQMGRGFQWFTITGLTPGARTKRNIVNIKNVNTGKTYITSVDTIVSLMKYAETK